MFAQIIQSVIWVQTLGFDMAEILGFEIRVNGAQRTFRDRSEVAFEAALFLKTRHRNDVVEVLDCATGIKVLMLEDGRTA